MKTLRVALTAAGALVALVGGAETATWGLSPVTMSVNAIAPQIVASGADGATTNGMSEAASVATGAAPPEATPVVYTAPPEPPAEIDTDGPRDTDNASAAAPAPTESASTTAPRLAGQEAAPTLSDADGNPVSQPISSVDTSSPGAGPAFERPD